jgi:hypothetical protein
MRRKSIWITLTVFGLIAAIAVGAVAYRSAQAAKATSSGLSYNLMVSGKGGFGPGVTDQQLAGALGITVDQLNTARQTARSNALKQAVDKGLITQAQADSLQNGKGAFPFGERWEGWLVQNGIDYQSLLANALGISVDDLNAAVLKARDAEIDQLVTDGRITAEQADLLKGKLALNSNSAFRDAMNSAFETAVNAAVKAGVITQSQADAILAQRSSSGMQGWGGLEGLGGPEFGFGHGGRGMRGGEGFGMGPEEHFRFGAPSQPTTPQSTATP